MKIIINIFILLFSCQVLASKPKIKIVTSITPLAGIIAMLVKEQTEIVSIANNNDCPHHYSLRPSDLLKIQNADIVFYINEQFDGFVGKLLNDYNSNVVKISNFPGLNIISNNSCNNWHIWLDLDNVKILLEQSSKILAGQFPNINKYINKNLEEAKKQIEELTKIKNEKLSLLKDVILLSDSLEYFFEKVQYRVVKLYNSSQKSLRYFSNIEQLLNTSDSKCLILSFEQNPLIYKNLKATLVRVESENWQVSQISNELFYNQYLKMINQVTRCLNY